MKIIQEPNPHILKFIRPTADAKPPFRKYTYCKGRTLKNGLFLFNYVTGEAVFLEGSDFSTDAYGVACNFNFPGDSYDGISAGFNGPVFFEPSCAAYLISHRFLVNSQNDDACDVDKIRDTVRTLDRIRFKGFRNFTILTTTDCNARCYYCFEKDLRKISMSEQTARDTADYIIRCCSRSGNNRIHLKWFGGEPLFNSSAIDTISSRLLENGIDFSSSMVSNGLLLDKKAIEKAVNLWKLKNIQITLDGTENIYNKTKAYVDYAGNAYKTVLANIAGLLKAGIRVSIRLNVSESNADSLDRLTDELADLFTERKPDAYAHILFQYNSEGMEKRRRVVEEKQDYLNKKLRALGFPIPGTDLEGYPMADSEGSPMPDSTGSPMADSEGSPMPDSTGSPAPDSAGSPVPVPAGSPMPDSAGSPGGTNGSAFKRQRIRIYHCMADSPYQIAILPDGRLHSCESVDSNYTWGSIYTGETKLDLCHPSASGDGVTSPIKYWTEYVTVPECRTCPAYPFCIRTTHCPGMKPGCYKNALMQFRRDIEKEMAELTAMTEPETFLL